MANKTIGESLLPVLNGLLLVLLVLAAGTLYLSQRGAAGERGVLLTLAQQSEAAAAAGRGAARALTGDAAAHARPLEALSSLPAFDASRLSAARQTEAAAVDRLLGELRGAAGRLAEGRGAGEVIRSAAANAAQLLPRLSAEVESLAALAGQPAPGPMVERIEAEARTIEQTLAELAGAGGDPAPTVARLAAAGAFLERAVRGLAGGDAGLGIDAVSGAAALDQLGEIQNLQALIDRDLQGAIAAADTLAASRAAATEVIDGAAAVGDAVATLRAGVSEAAAFPPLVPLALIGAAFLTFVIIGLLHHLASKARAAASEQVEENNRNQEAILRLLDELSSLADGDLTVQATVSEDITGAIADSINYAIEALRELVVTIDEAATKVDGGGRQARASAAHLAQASDSQAKQVHAATDSIASMADSIEEVSHNAERSAEVARHSVEIAHKGGDAVRRTIDGMNTIRETIQETSKRIKRLGESSQEIGNIVELINDIAEQTNILALNASIQASMAGEAGRGFAVVADEVQRLAERSANATKQIEVLVKTIQSDTNEAVVSMERSTTDVVSGALLAENAGASLDEIEQVSNQIASLVQNISNTARQQATNAADITRNMGVLQEISAQAAESTGATSTAIGALAEMAAELRRSVAGFTLPDKPRLEEPVELHEPVAKVAKVTKVAVGAGA